MTSSYKMISKGRVFYFSLSHFLFSSYREKDFFGSFPLSFSWHTQIIVNETSSEVGPNSHASKATIRRFFLQQPTNGNHLLIASSSLLLLGTSVSVFGEMGSI